MKQIFNKAGIKKITRIFLLFFVSICIIGGSSLLFSGLDAVQNAYADHCGSIFDQDKLNVCLAEHTGSTDCSQITDELEREDCLRENAASIAASEEEESTEDGTSTGGTDSTDTEANPEDKGGGKVSKEEVNWGRFAAMLVGIFTPVIAVLVEFCGQLMGVAVIFGNFGSGEATYEFKEILYVVWLVMRDGTNYCFIVVLIGISGMSVFGAANPENNNFEIKKMLPKFIIAVVGVNFTWFFCVVILDVSTVATHIVYGIPKTLIQAEAFQQIEECSVNDFYEEQRNAVPNGYADALAEELKKKGSLSDKETAINYLKVGLDNYEIAYLSKYPDLKEKEKKDIGKYVEKQKKKLEKFNDKQLVSYIRNNATDIRIDTSGCFPGYIITKNGSEKNDSLIGAVKINGTYDATASGGSAHAKAAEFVAAQGKDNPARFVEDYGKFIIVWMDFRWDRFQGNSIAALFAYNVMQVQNLPRTVRETLTGEVDVEDLIVNAGFALVFMVIIIIAFLVMVIVLFERVMIIWINIVLSPLAALLPFATDFGLSEANFDDKGIGVKAFISAAFLPALMGVPLVLGYILIMAGQAIPATSLTERVVFETELINGVHTIHQLLWYVICIVVLWSSVEVAKSSSKFAGDLITGIADRVKSIGTFIIKSPIYATFIPMGKASGKDGEQAYGSVGLILRKVDDLRMWGERKVSQQAAAMAGDKDGGEARSAYEILNKNSNIDKIMKEVREIYNSGVTGQQQTVSTLQEVNTNSKYEHIREAFNKALGKDDLGAAISTQDFQGIVKIASQDSSNKFGDKRFLEDLSKGGIRPPTAPAAGTDVASASGTSATDGTTLPDPAAAGETTDSSEDPTVT